MPFIGSKKKNKEEKQPNRDAETKPDAAITKSSPKQSSGTNPYTAGEASTSNQPKYQFHCQLAHGSPTGLIRYRSKSPKLKYT